MRCGNPRVRNQSRWSSYNNYVAIKGPSLRSRSLRSKNCKNQPQRSDLAVHRRTADSKNGRPRYATGRPVRPFLVWLWFRCTACYGSTSSTRRFLARPASLRFVATGASSPTPAAFPLAGRDTRLGTNGRRGTRLRHTGIDSETPPCWQALPRSAGGAYVSGPQRKMEKCEGKGWIEKSWLNEASPLQAGRQILGWNRERRIDAGR